MKLFKFLFAGVVCVVFLAFPTFSSDIPRGISYQVTL